MVDWNNPATIFSEYGVFDLSHVRWGMDIDIYIFFLSPVT
jgi:hypothetical protein